MSRLFMIAATLAFFASACTTGSTDNDTTVTTTATSETTGQAGGPTTAAPAGDCTGAQPPNVEPIAVDVPGKVAETRNQLIQAARTCDWAELDAIAAAADNFSFTFGGIQGPPSDYWKRSEQQIGQSVPLGSPVTQMLDRLLAETEPAVHGGRYVWPKLFGWERGRIVEPSPADKPHVDNVANITGMTAEEMTAAGSYSAWRVGINPDGTWAFFIAGD